jgi:hypothetical protein
MKRHAGPGAVLAKGIASGTDGRHALVPRARRAGGSTATTSRENKEHAEPAAVLEQTVRGINGIGEAHNDKDGVAVVGRCVAYVTPSISEPLGRPCCGCSVKGIDFGSINQPLP